MLCRFRVGKFSAEAKIDFFIFQFKNGFLDFFFSCTKDLNIRYNIAFPLYLSLTGVVWLKNKEIFKTFFREKPAMLLVELRNSKAEIYASSLAKQIDCTYSPLVKILQEMQVEGLINFDKQGRLKLLALTKKGQDVANKIDDIRGLL